MRRWPAATWSPTPLGLRALIGLTGQFAAVDELLTGRENLELVGLFYQLTRAERRRQAAGVLERFSLAAAADELVRTYSGGMRRRLDVGASLIGSPRVLFLDEPTTGLDPRTRNEVWQFVEDLLADGTTVLLSTQYMEEAEHLAHRIVVMDSGAVVARGTSAELKERLGGDVLEARVARTGDLDLASAAIADLGEGTPRVDPDQRIVSLPTRGATAVLIAAGERLQERGVALEDLGIRHPLARRRVPRPHRPCGGRAGRERSADRAVDRSAPPTAPWMDAPPTAPRTRRPLPSPHRRTPTGTGRHPHWRRRRRRGGRPGLPGRARRPPATPSAWPGATCCASCATPGCW